MTRMGLFLDFSPPSPGVLCGVLVGPSGEKSVAQSLTTPAQGGRGPDSLALRCLLAHGLRPSSF